MSLDIWAVYPPCEHCGGPEREAFDSMNITHNLGAMWREAGAYDALYMSAGKRCEEVLPTLMVAEDLMMHDPPRFQKHEPSNGWGSYSGAVGWLRELIEHMQRNPNAVIKVWK